MFDFVEASGALETIGQRDEAWAYALDCFGAAGYEFAIYLTCAQYRNGVDLLTNVPQIYDRVDPADDPFLHYCCSNYQPTRTGVHYLPEHDYLPPEAKQFIANAASVGFTAGVAVPTRIQGSARYGGFNLGTSLARDAFEASFAGQIDAVRSFCLLAHRRLEDLAAAVQEETAALSPRENEIVRLVAGGKSRKEIAQLCGLSVHTVADYTKSAYRKLGVRNRGEAAALLFASGDPLAPREAG